MRIGIIGSGNVGGTLGKGWAKGGHSVIFGSRDPGSAGIKALVAESGPLAGAGSLAEAAAASEVVLIATPWPATREIVQGLGKLGDKIILDATNPLLPGLTGLEVGTNSSGGEQVALWTGSTRVVKVFNTVGFSVMANPRFDEGGALLFYCGDDSEAKGVAARLARELGFEAADAGPLSQARLLEPFALLWIKLSMMPGYSRDFAFKIIKHD